MNTPPAAGRPIRTLSRNRLQPDPGRPACGNKTRGGRSPLPARETMALDTESGGSPRPRVETCASRDLRHDGSNRGGQVEVQRLVLIDQRRLAEPALRGLPARGTTDRVETADGRSHLVRV